MNIYLSPIITELVNLWTRGEKTEDVSMQFSGNKDFLMKAILLWVMHDFPGYGVASSLQTQGLYGCPPCGPEVVPSYSALHLGKIIYHGHRKFLPKGYRWRSEEYIEAFNGQMEPSMKPPQRWNAWDWLANWEHVDEGSLALENSGMKALSKLYDLEYWGVFSLNSICKHVFFSFHILKFILKCTKIFKCSIYSWSPNCENEIMYAGTFHSTPP
jgi:hypothetical protein